MDVKLKNTAIFLEESSLMKKEFLYLYEKMMKDPDELFLFIDKNIDNSVQNAIKRQPMDGYIFDGIVDILKNNPKLKLVDTSGNFDFKELEKEIKKAKYENIYFLTNNENIFHSLEDLKKEFKKAKTIKLSGFDVEEWKIAKKTIKNAFYVNKDDYTHTYDPQDLEYVYSPKYGYLKLFKDNVQSGGEGTIYKTYNGMLAKVYFKEHLSYINYKKLQYMMNMDVYNPYINWPKDLIYQDSNYIGYVMDEVVDAKSLDFLRIEGFEGYSELNRYEISLEFLKQVYYLHQKNIVIGDLKLDNILIKYPNQVYLIDVGSYQVKDYPCTVYHPEYTKKMYTEEDLRKYLRSPEDEYYAINKIIFEILVGKKPNYDRNNTEIAFDNQEFHYPLIVGKIDKNTPVDLKRWSIMTQKMREMFYFYFKDNKVSYLSEWINEISQVIEMINKMGGKK